MNFRNLLKRVTNLLTVEDKTKKYFTYVILITAVLGVIGFFVNRSHNAELAELEAQADRDRRVREVEHKELMEQISDLRFLTDNTEQRLADLREQELVSQVEIKRLEDELEDTQTEAGNLETRLSAAHETLAGRELTNSFLGEQITEELANYFPEANNIFFSETQSSLFRTNPETANLIYTVITENAVRIQLVDNLGGQIEILEEQVEQSEEIIELRGEEILAMVVVVDQYERTQENLEAALSTDRRMIATLERQIAILTKKNFFQKVLPSLNVVLGPYYDPFKNQGGFGVSLGLGWRF